MKLRIFKKGISGFTFWDVLIVVVTVVVGAGFVLRTLHRPRSSRINCICHLKQVGMAMRMYSYDNNERFPWATTNRNQQRVLQSVASYFTMTSTELNNPKILACPVDRRRPVNNFAQLTNTRISYFIGLDAKETEPGSILAGDRNISTNNRILSGQLELTRTNSVRWTGDIHKHAGNLALGDGSVHQMTTALLQRQVTAHPTDPFRLLIP